MIDQREHEAMMEALRHDVLSMIRRIATENTAYTYDLGPLEWLIEKIIDRKLAKHTPVSEMRIG